MNLVMSTQLRLSKRDKIVGNGKLKMADTPGLFNLFLNNYFPIFFSIHLTEVAGKGSCAANISPLMISPHPPNP